MNRGPDVLLVHGAWHGSWAFEDLKAALQERGWTVRTVDLASIDSGSADLHDDAQIVRESLAAVPAPTIVVGHSYGGMVATEGAAGATNLVGLVYLAAAVPEVGQSVWTEPIDPTKVPSWLDVDTATGLVRALDAGRVFYNDCPPELTARAVTLLRRQSLKTFITPALAAAWKEAPSAYLVCDDDNCTPVTAQEVFAARATYVEHINTGHSPFMSQPAAVADFIDSSAAKFTG